MFKLTRQLLLALTVMLSFIASAAPLQLEVGSVNQSVSTLDVVSIDVGAIDQADSVSVDSESQDGYLLLDAGADVCLPNTRRVFSVDEVASQGEEPDYHLLIAFDNPDLLTAAQRAESSTYFLAFWQLATPDSSLRVGGWKESNLQYRFLQSSLS
ncbi:hypothetical protein ACPV5Q_07430 [Vibrio astriarenae]